MTNKLMKDALSIIAITFLGVGIALTVLRQARAWEFGILLLIIGSVIFYVRYYSEMLKEKEEQEITISK